MNPIHFGEWPDDVHNNLRQMYSIKYAIDNEAARGSKERPMEINCARRTAVVAGSCGAYRVSLDSCTCPAFTGEIGQPYLISNGGPCKHIYRLAIALGLIEQDQINAVLFEVGIDSAARKALAELRKAVKVKPKKQREIQERVEEAIRTSLKS